MPLQTQGFSGVVPEVDASWRAQRISIRPLEVGTLGHYRMSAATGNLAATLASGAAIYSFRWTDATRLCVMTSINVQCAVSAAITTAVATRVELMLARGFTASDSGGTALTPIAGNSQKNRTSFGTSLVGDARIATTAALTPGTRTLDTQANGGIVFGTGTAVGTTCLGDESLYTLDELHEHPIVLAQNEGFIIRFGATGPATGTLLMGVDVAWAEVSAY